LKFITDLCNKAAAVFSGTRPRREEPIRGPSPESGYGTFRPTMDVPVRRSPGQSMAPQHPIGTRPRSPGHRPDSRAQAIALAQGLLSKTLKSPVPSGPVRPGGRTAQHPWDQLFSRLPPGDDAAPVAFAEFVAEASRQHGATPMRWSTLEALAAVDTGHRTAFLADLRAVCPSEVPEVEFARTAKALAEVGSGGREAFEMARRFSGVDDHRYVIAMLGTIGHVPQADRPALDACFRRLPPESEAEKGSPALGDINRRIVSAMQQVGMAWTEALIGQLGSCASRQDVLALFQSFAAQHADDRGIWLDSAEELSQPGVSTDAVVKALPDTVERHRRGERALADSTRMLEARGFPAPVVKRFAPSFAWNVGPYKARRPSESKELLRKMEQHALWDIHPEALKQFLSHNDKCLHELRRFSDAQVLEASATVAALWTPEFPPKKLPSLMRWALGLTPAQREALPRSPQDGRWTNASDFVFEMTARAMSFPVKAPDLADGAPLWHDAIGEIVDGAKPPWDTLPLTLLVPFKDRVASALASAHPDKLDRKAFDAEDPECRLVNYFQLLDEMHAVKYLSGHPYFDRVAAERVTGSSEARQDFLDKAHEVQAAESVMLAYETRVLRKRFIDPAIQKARELGVPLVIVPNLTGGGTSATALGMRELAAQGVKVFATKQASTESFENSQELAHLFTGEQVEFMVQKRPLVVVLDASPNARHPDAFRGYRNFTAVLNHAQGLDARADWEKGGLTGDPFRPERPSQDALDRKVAAMARDRPRPERGLGLHYASAGESLLKTSFGESPGKFAWSQVKHPGVVCVQTSLSLADIEAAERRKDPEAREALKAFDRTKLAPNQVHKWAPFDDDDHAQSPLLYLGKRGNLKFNPPVHLLTRQFYKALEQLAEPGPGPAG
jgi:hypothetical protein